MRAPPHPPRASRRPGPHAQTSMDPHLRKAALGIPRAGPPRQAVGRTHQAAHQPARPRARVFAGRRRGLRGDRRRSRRRLPLHQPGQPGGVVTNGTAVLGLGAIGPLAAKPVMEGKAVLFKKFAGIDVFDIELTRTISTGWSTSSPRSSRPRGINLEDIKAPDCFYVERKLRERMKIPVFHDDQHGTAIVVGAAMTNGLKIVGKELSRIKLVCSGAGAAALACLDLLVHLACRRQRVGRGPGRRGLQGPSRTDGPRQGALRAGHAAAHAGRDHRRRRRLPRAVAGGVLKRDMVARMAANPLVFALANPTPEILPEEVRAVRSDAIIAPAAPTTRTRSTTSCASRSCSAAPWTRAPRRSPRDGDRRGGRRGRAWRGPRRPTSWRPPTAPDSSRSAPST